MRGEAIQLNSVTETWSDEQIDHLLEALKRDRSLNLSELAIYVDGKNAADVRELVSVLTTCTEEEVLDVKETCQNTLKPEESIDTTKHCSPYEYAFSKTVSEVLKDHAAQLDSNNKLKKPCTEAVANPTTNVDISYPELYRYLAALMHDRPLPILSPMASGVILDLLSRLAGLLKLFHPTSTDATPMEPSIANMLDLQAAYANMCDKVTHSVGTYIACAATVQLVSSHFKRLKTEKRNGISKQYPPITPLILCKRMRPVQSLRAKRWLRTYLLGVLSGELNVPKLPENTVTSTLFTSRINSTLRNFIKQVNMFTLNPFRIPQSVMCPFQTLTQHLCRQNGIRRLNLEQTISTLSPQLTQSIGKSMQRNQLQPHAGNRVEASPESMSDRECQIPDTDSEEPQAKRSRSCREISTPINSPFVSVPFSPTPSTTFSNPFVLSGKLKTSDFFKRIEGKSKRARTDKKLLKRMQVHEVYADTPHDT